jgi:hypothetical protein
MDKENTVYEHNALKSKETLSFETAWIKLEDIMFREISQTQKDTCFMSSLVYGIKKKKIPEVDSQMIITRGRGLGRSGNKKLLINGHKVLGYRMILYSDYIC